MDKKLIEYKKEITSRIEHGDDIVLLRNYHTQRVSEFMHERQMHLYVTLFFGFLVLLFTGTLLLVATLGLALLTGLAGAATLLLAATEVFYVAHYYRLENGVQALYTITAQLYSSK